MESEKTIYDTIRELNELINEQIESILFLNCCTVEDTIVQSTVGDPFEYTIVKNGIKIGRVVVHQRGLTYTIKAQQFFSSKA